MTDLLFPQAHGARRFKWKNDSNGNVYIWKYTTDPIVHCILSDISYYTGVGLLGFEQHLQNLHLHQILFFYYLSTEERIYILIEDAKLPCTLTWTKQDFLWGRLWLGLIRFSFLKMGPRFSCRGSLVPRVSLFQATSQRFPAKGGIGAESSDLATLLHLHLDRNLCMSVLRSADRWSDEWKSRGTLKRREQQCSAGSIDVRNGSAWDERQSRHERPSDPPEEDDHPRRCQRGRQRQTSQWG